MLWIKQGLPLDKQDLLAARLVAVFEGEPALKYQDKDPALYAGVEGLGRFLSEMDAAYGEAQEPELAATSGVPPVKDQLLLLLST